MAQAVVTDLAGKLKAVHSGNLVNCDHEIKMLSVNPVPSFLAVIRRSHRVSEPFQCLPMEAANFRIVVDVEDCARADTAG